MKAEQLREAANEALSGLRREIGKPGLSPSDVRIEVNLRTFLDLKREGVIHVVVPRRGLVPTTAWEFEGFGVTRSHHVREDGQIRAVVETEWWVRTS